MTNTVSRIISDDTLSRAIQIESAGKVSARAATSSATGLFQFLDATWRETVRKHRPDWLTGHTDAQLLAMRLDAVRSIEMGARFWEDNARIIGAGWTDGDLYLAHFAGPSVARKLFSANPDEPCSAIFSNAAISANRSILAGKTCRQVRAWAARRMAQAGGRNWIGVYMSGDKPAVPRAAKTIAAGSSASATVIVTAGTQQSWHLTQWSIAAGLLLAVAGVIGAAWWFWRRHPPNKIETQGADYGME